MANKINRRDFIGLGAAFAAAGCRTKFGGFPAITSVRSPNGLLRHMSIGCGNRAWADINAICTHKMIEMAAFCDVDSKYLAQAKAKFPKARFYRDWREMYEAEGDKVDSVLVGAPDHHHVAMATAAMKRGKHVYLQKPMAKTMQESAYLRQTARECGVVTQMGNQGSSGTTFRRGVEILQSGLIGDVSEVHVWTNRPVWPQGDWAKSLLSRPNDPVPDGLDWDSWIGTAAMRPYKGERGVDPRDYPWCVKVGNTKVYHQFNWRGFADFGAGALGDMASHLMNLPYRGLRLGAMAWANCRFATEVNPGIYPAASIVDIGFAGRPGLKFTWYEGGVKPDPDLTAPILQVEKGIPVGGCVIVGSKGALYSTDNYGQTSYVMMAGDKKPVSIMEHEACKAVAQTLPRRHEERTTGNYGEFIDAILGETPFIEETHSRCYGDIEHSVPLMEGMLAACAAQCVPGTRLNWNTATQRFDNAEANAMIRPHIRSGWEF